MPETKTTKYVRLGDYIEEYNLLNSDNKIKIVKSVSVIKELKDTNAKVDKTELSKYKVVLPGMMTYVQTTKNEKCFACCVNHFGEPIVVTSVNKVFFISKPDELNIDYLFLILSRQEFDRYAIFNSWGSAREVFQWENLVNLEIPLPDIEVQRELVATYNGLKALAEQNEALLPRLSAACHAYIVDCRAKYPSVPLGEYIEQCDERAGDNFTVDNVIGISNVKSLIPTKADMKDVSLAPYKLFKPNEFCYVTVTSRNGGKISLAMNNTAKTYIVSSSYLVFCCKDENILLPEYLFLLLNRTEFDRYTRFNSWGSARETFDWNEMCRVEIPVPPIEIQKAIVEVFSCSERAKQIASKARARMKNLCPALVQRAANS